MKKIKLTHSFSFPRQGFCSAGEAVKYKIAGASVFVLADGFECYAEIDLQTFKNITK